MKRLVLMVISALICGMILTGCGSDKPIEAEETSNEILQGKWKLILINLFFTIEEGNSSIDYSKKNITYEFRANNVLTVSGEIDNIDYRGHEIGKHSYKVLPLPPSGPLGPTHIGLPVKIGAKNHNIHFGWMFFEFYEGPAMHINTQNGTLILVRVD